MHQKPLPIHISYGRFGVALPGGGKYPHP
jgi:hypothetical protein